MDEKIKALKNIEKPTDSMEEAKQQKLKKEQGEDYSNGKGNYDLRGRPCWK